MLKSLKARYDHSSLKDDLARELPWAQAVRQKLITTAATLPPFGRERIEVFFATLETVPDLRMPPAPAVSPPAASPPSV